LNDDTGDSEEEQAGDLEILFESQLDNIALNAFWT